MSDNSCNCNCNCNNDPPINQIIGQTGDPGSDGWTALYATIVDGDRVVLQIVSWFGGTGTPPPFTGFYLSGTGYVEDIGLATDIRGLQGEDGAIGADGEDGWTPILALITDPGDSTREVLKVVSFEGGTGTMPSTTDRYIGSTGYVSTAAAATNLKGTNGTNGTNGATGIPSGFIGMWSGSIGAIPVGWFLCDGNNGTPDLKGKFIVGYSAAFVDYDAIGKVGGALSVTLTSAQLPAHSHTASAIPDHSHTNGLGSPIVYNGGVNVAYGVGGVTGLAGGHTHTVDDTGQTRGAAHENRPPYYVLAYIMKA